MEGKWPVLYRKLMKLKPRGMSNRKFGEQHGISSNSLTRWKLGEKPSQDSLLKLSKEFNKPVDWFLREEGEERADTILLPPEGLLNKYASLLQFITTAGLHDHNKFKEELQSLSTEMQELKNLFLVYDETTGGEEVHNYYDLFIRAEDKLNALADKYAQARNDIDLYETGIIAIASARLPIEGGGIMEVSIRDLLEAHVSERCFGIIIERRASIIKLVVDPLPEDHHYSRKLSYVFKFPEKEYRVGRIKKIEGRWEIRDFFSRRKIATVTNLTPVLLGRAALMWVIQKNGYLPNMP